MLQNIRDLYGYQLAATDGAIGHLKDFYFDDRYWAVRYLVVDTGSWLSGRLVLISPHAFGRLDPATKTLAMNLTRQQIETSPSIESHRPVSRQFEIDYYQYYGWPEYWNAGATRVVGGLPVMPPPPSAMITQSRQPIHLEDWHLQSTQAITGYSLHGTDGEIGSVNGFRVDDQSWLIAQLTVETGHWYAGKEILISAHAINRISYEDSQVFVDLPLESLRHTADHHVAEIGT